MKRETICTAKKIESGCSISISDRQNGHPIDLQTKLLIYRVVIGALRFECIPSEVFRPQVSVTIVDDAEIRRMNNEYRGIDRSTDVLSFPLLEDGIPTPDDIDYENGTVPLGDIVISIDHVHAQAEEYGHSVRREIAFLCVHSVLHLLGYDHETSEEDERIMFERQREILDSIGITR